MLSDGHKKRTHNSGNMIKLSTLLVSASLLITMAIFNPEEKAYQDFIANYLYEQKQADNSGCDNINSKIGIGFARRLFSTQIDIGDACSDINTFRKKVQHRNLEDEIRAEAISAERCNLFFGSLYRFEYEGTVYGTVGILGKMRVVRATKAPLPTAASE